MRKPDKCCEMGTYECQVPMPIAGRRQDIDLCIADIVASLNAANITTVASCCGHGKLNGSIVLEDGRELVIREFNTANHVTGSNGKEYSPSEWQSEKQEIRKLAVAIRGSTREEFPADLANLEDYIYKQYKN